MINQKIKQNQLYLLARNFIIKLTNFHYLFKKINYKLIFCGKKQPIKNKKLLSLTNSDKTKDLIMVKYGKFYN